MTSSKAASASRRVEIIPAGTVRHPLESSSPEACQVVLIAGDMDFSVGPQWETQADAESYARQLREALEIA